MSISTSARLRARFLFPVLSFVLTLVIFPVPSFAAKPAPEPVPSLATDLQTLVTQGNDVNSQLAALSLTLDNSCIDLGGAITSVQGFTTAVNEMSGGLSAPLSLDVDSITALNDLSVLSAGIAGVLPALSTNISTITMTSDQADYQASIDAMLQLSSDIGTMADRILEMSDKILVMADNIGLMADRILLTQQIQSSNMALTQGFILSTQDNMVALSATVDTSAYSFMLTGLIDAGNVLSLDMNTAQLTEANMATELAAFESRVNDYLTDTLTLSVLVDSGSRLASHNLNGDTLTMLGDLSVINAALADALNRFALSVNTLAPTTDVAVLNDSVYSMLRLAADIGLMGSRIVEMGGDINIMADNIGLMALRIIDTQTLQQDNLDLTRSNLTTAQITTVSLIAAYGL